MSIITLKLNRCQTMTKDDISKELKSARVGYDYLKITFYNNVYIQVFFTRDYKTYIKTSSRDLMLWKEIDVIERQPYRLSVLEDFLFRWILKLNR